MVGRYEGIFSFLFFSFHLGKMMMRTRMMIRVLVLIIYTQKGPDPANKEGVLIFKTPQAIIIGHYHAGVEPGNAVNDLENLGGHLAKSQ